MVNFNLSYTLLIEIIFFISCQMPFIIKTSVIKISLINISMQSHSYKLSDKDISLIKSTFRKLCENYYDDPSDMTICHLSTLFGISQVAIKTSQQANNAGIIPIIEILKVKSKGKAGNLLNGINNLINYINTVINNGKHQKTDTMNMIVAGVTMGSECPQLYTLSCTMLLRIIDVNSYLNKIDSQQQLQIIENIGKNCTINPSLSIDFLLAVCKQKSSNILKNLVKSGIIKYLMNTYLFILLQQTAKLESTGKINLYRLLKFFILFGGATKINFVKEREKGLVSVIFNYEQYISVVKAILGNSFDIEYCLAACDDTKNQAQWIDKLYLWSYDENFAKLVSEDRAECIQKLLNILKTQLNEDTQVKIYAILQNLSNDFELQVEKIPIVPKYNKSTKSALKLINSLLQFQETADKLKNIIKNGNSLEKLEDHVQSSVDPQVPKIFAELLLNIDSTNAKIKHHDKAKLDLFSQANAQLLLDRAKRIPRRKQDLKNFGEILSKKSLKGQFEKDVLEKAKQLSMESIYRCILMKQRGKLINPQQLNRLLDSIEKVQENIINLNKMLRIMQIYILKNPDWVKGIQKQSVLNLFDALENYSINLNKKKRSSSQIKMVINWEIVKQILKVLFEAGQWQKNLDNCFKRKRMFWLLCASNPSENIKQKIMQYLKGIQSNSQTKTENQIILGFLSKSSIQMKNILCIQFQSSLSEAFNSGQIELNKFLMASYIAEKWSENGNQITKQYLQKKFIPMIFESIAKNGEISDHICQFLTAALPLTPSHEQFVHIYEKISPQQWLSKYGKFAIVLYNKSSTITKTRAQQYIKSLSNNISKDFPDERILIQILTFLQTQHRILSKDITRTQFQTLILKSIFRSYYGKGSKQQINWYWMLYPFYIPIMKHIISILSQRIEQASTQQEAKQNAQLLIQILQTNNNNQQLTQKEIHPIVKDYRVMLQKIGGKNQHNQTINALEIENLRNTVNSIKAGNQLNQQKKNLNLILDELDKKQVETKQRKNQQNRKKEEMKKKERKMSMDKMKIQRQEKIKSQTSLPQITQQEASKIRDQGTNQIQQNKQKQTAKISEKTEQTDTKKKQLSNKNQTQQVKKQQNEKVVTQNQQKEQVKIIQEKKQTVIKPIKTNQQKNRIQPQKSNPKPIQNKTKIQPTKTVKENNNSEQQDKNRQLYRVQAYFKNLRGDQDQIMIQNPNFDYYQQIRKQIPVFNAKLQLEDKNFDKQRQQFDLIEEDYEILINKIQKQQQQRLLGEHDMKFFEALKLLKKIVDGQEIPEKMNLIIPIFQKQTVPSQFKDTLGYLLTKGYSLWQDSRILHLLLKKQKTILSRLSCYNLLNYYPQTFVLSHRWKLIGREWLDLSMGRLKQKSFTYIPEACIVAQYNLPDIEDIQYFQKKKYLQAVAELFTREKGIQTEQEIMYASLLVGTSSKLNEIRQFYLKKRLHLLIIYLMSQHADHIGALSNGSYALSYLISMQSAQSTKLSLMKEQFEKVFMGYQVCIKATQFSHKQRSLIQSSCSFISNLTYSNDQVRNNLRQYKVVELIMEMFLQLLKHMKNTLSNQTGQVQQISESDMNTLKHILRTLGNCSVSELCAKDLMDQDFPSHSIVLCDKIGFLAELDLSRMKLLKLLVDIYANLTVHKYEIKLFYRSGVTDFIINLLQNATPNAQILMGAIDTIDGLCQQPSIQKFAIEQKNLSFILIDILKTQDDQKVITKSTRLLTNLTINKSIIPKILEANLLSVLGNIVLLSHHNRKLQNYINKIINRVYSAQPNIDIILKSGYLDCLIRCIETSEIIEDSHVDILLDYSKNLPNFLNKRAFMCLIKVLIDKPSNKQIIDKCIQIFKILLSKSPDKEQEDLIIEGAPKMYQSLLMTNPLDILYLLGSHCIRSQKARHLMRKIHANKIIDIINSENFLNVASNDPKNYSIAVTIFGNGKSDDKQNIRLRIKQAIQIVNFVIFNNPEPLEKNFTADEEQQAIKTLKSKMACKLFRVDGSYKKARVDIDDEYAIRAYKHPEGQVKKKYYLPVRNIRDWRFHFQKDRSKQESKLLQRENKELWKHTYFVKNEKGFFSEDVKMENCVTLMGGIKWGEFVSINLQFQSLESKISFVKSVTILMSMFNS